MNRSDFPTLPFSEILVVDDVRLNRELIAEYLVDYHHKVYEACSGQEALTQIANHPIDVVFLDLTMPTMNGIQTAHKIKSNPHFKRLPLIAMASPNTSRYGASLHEIFHGYLDKPVDRIQFFITLGRALRSEGCSINQQFQTVPEA